MNMKLLTLLISISLLFLTTVPGIGDQVIQGKDHAGLIGENVDDPLKLWYLQPAERWLEALPLGNGRLGAMVFGGVKTERIALNETTLWSGAQSDQHENPESAETFRKIRELFSAQKYEEAQPLIGKLLGRRLNYGTNLPAGDLLLVQGGIKEPVQDYRRELDLDQAMATVAFTAGGVRFSREVIASHPDGIIAIRLEADKHGSIDFTLRYDGGNLPDMVKSEDTGILLIKGKAVEKKHSDGTCGVNFQARCRILNIGGTVSAKNDCLIVKGADTVTILISLNTDFTGTDPGIICDRQINDAKVKGWTKIKRDHIADHQALFRRVTLDLGPAPVPGQPTDIRWKAMANGKEDPAMEALFFQYGRYLVIAGSREDSPLPMHLQGIWNDHLAADMGWTCDFHLDINTEQNYWPTETTNLSECGWPLFRFIETLQEPGHRTAINSYGIDKGWVCHVVTNAWGFTAPGWGGGWGLHVTGGIWIASHLWEHYIFTGDKEFLAKTAYPVLKGAAEFFLEYLFADPKTGYLITGPSVSPEMGGETEPGATHDLTLIYDLFSNCIGSCKTLGKDAEFKVRLEQALAKLPPYKIGFNGQIQEWLNKDDGGITNHRHTSHLVGLFPLARITPRSTPELARAAERSLQIRMQDPNWEDVEWSAGNSVCYFARLGNGAMAYKNLVNLITADADANLMTYSRGGIAGAEQNIFVLDGNTSGTAGIAEMLLQSHNGEIELLPALPEAWSSGSVKGLRARGGYTVDIDWKNGKVTDYHIVSIDSREVKIRINGEPKTIFSKKF
jgi:alpha-L-fucosidase 2